MAWLRSEIPTNGISIAQHSMGKDRSNTTEYGIHRAGKGTELQVLLPPDTHVRGMRLGPIHCRAIGSHSSLIPRENSPIDDKRYTTHSFWIGAATTAKAAGLDDSHIKTLGRWKSDAYQVYIRTPHKELAKLSAKLVSTPGHNQQ